MPGTPFTIGTSFGIGTGPTYRGSQVIQPLATGNNPQLIDQVCAASATTVAWSGTVPYTDLEPAAGLGGGFGVMANTYALNANTATPACTVNFLSGTSVVLSIPLIAGQSFAQASTNGFNTACTSITTISVVGDATSTMELFGILNISI